LKPVFHGEDLIGGRQEAFLKPQARKKLLTSPDNYATINKLGTGTVKELNEEKFS
jgi:hypothetical protein